MAKEKTVAKTDTKEKTTTKAAAPAKAAATPEPAKKRGPPPIEKPEYGIDQLGEALGVSSMASLRMRLRAIDGLQSQYKKGRLWDFGSKKNLESVVKQLLGKKG